jgi:hypothetical protein
MFELKTPFVGRLTTSRSDGNRLKLKATPESYISQATEYVDSINERPDATSTGSGSTSKLSKPSIATHHSAPPTRQGGTLLNNQQINLLS